MPKTIRYSDVAQNTDEQAFQDLVTGANSWHNGNDQRITKVEWDIENGEARLAFVKSGVANADIDSTLSSLDSAVDSLAIPFDNPSDIADILAE